ncbi:hypothetical protein DINM_002265 [Dirofilaria immitis]|nr:hypothetical protein [Dirofilaria immitis]
MYPFVTCGNGILKCGFRIRHEFEKAFMIWSYARVPREVSVLSKKRAELTSITVKVFLGGGILFTVFILLVLLILFISENMFVGIFLPVQMVFTVRIDKHPILYEYHLEDLTLISNREYNHLIKYFAFDIYAQSFIKSLGAETIVEATLPSQSMIHYIHPVWKAQLLQLVNETREGLKLKSRIYLRRMRVQEQRGILMP